MSIPEQLYEALSEPYTWARAEKGRGRKVVGTTPMYFPEELVHASGALPVLLQSSNEPITAGWSHIFPYYCGFVTGNIDLAAKGELDFLDGVVVSDICFQMREATGIMQRLMPAATFIHMHCPLWWSSEEDTEKWKPLVVAQLEKCRKALEEVVGKKITDGDIEASIAVYAQNRELLGEIEGLRSRKPGIISASEMAALVASSMVMSKEKHNVLLKQLIDELSNSSAQEDKRVKIYLSGMICFGVMPDLLEFIEDSGAVVVGDDFYLGARYFSVPSPDQAMPPLDALANQYLDLKIPCPTRCLPEADWASHVIERSGEVGASGLIALIPKWCQPIMGYQPLFRNKLEKAGVPNIFLELEPQMSALGTMEGRIEAFIQVLEARRGQNE